MPIYSSLDRLNAMHTLFTTQGNGRLDQGEVDAIAAFDRGLSSASRAKVHGRVVEMYQDSKYSSGQRDRMRTLLQSTGYTLGELEGVDPNSAAGFAKLPKAAQFERITDLASEWSDEGATKVVKLKNLDMISRGKLSTGLDKVESGIMKAKGADTFIGDAELRQVFVNNAGKKELVGYRFEIPIYANDHDVNEAHYFNLKGQHLGSEYVGE